MPKLFDNESGKVVSMPAADLTRMVRVQEMDREIWMRKNPVLKVERLACLI
jgi:hypothetical protein